MMRTNNISFSDIAKHLSEALKSSGDNRLRPFLAEYLVASKLEEHGHKVEPPHKIGADLQLIDIPRKVEVKSSESGNPDWACAASFRDGRSILNNQFDYCVFVVFQNFAPKEYLVFRLNDLKEVPEKRRGVYGNNPCLLFRDIEDADDEPLEIEVKLHEHPEQFRDCWHKIK
jgi:hypothetical protein